MNKVNFSHIITNTISITFSILLFQGCMSSTPKCECKRYNCQKNLKTAIIAEGCSTNGFVVTRRTVTDAISAAGFVPLILPNTVDTNRIDAIIDTADALIIFGAIQGSAKCRNDFEIRLIHRAAEKKIPIVGFCHGHQVINKAFGGTNRRNPQNPNVKIVHRDKVSPFIKDCFHEVTVKPGSRVARGIGEGKQIVNTSHSYSVDKLADGFEITAVAPDGVVEAIEHRSLPITGVQFHPERIVSVSHDPKFLKLIEILLKGE